jgi:hypothetical protein
MYVIVCSNVHGVDPFLFLVVCFSGWMNINSMSSII